MEINLATEPDSPGGRPTEEKQLPDSPGGRPTEEKQLPDSVAEQPKESDIDDAPDSVNEDTEEKTDHESNKDDLKIDAEVLEIDEEVIQQLTEGFLSTFLPEGEKAKVTLEELLQNQKVLIETVQHEKSKFTECHSFQDLSEVMNQARQYYNKLVTVKKDMGALHEKSVKLKKRALRLQQQKQKEMLQLEQKHEKELEKERALMARPVKRSSSETQNSGGII